MESKNTLTVSHQGQADAKFRQALATAIRNSNKDRDQIAMELSSKVGVRVSRRMLNEYSATSQAPYRFPAIWLAALCEILGDDSLLRTVLSPRLNSLLELGEREFEVHRNSRAKQRAIESLLSSPERKQQ